MISAPIGQEKKARWNGDDSPCGTGFDGVNKGGGFVCCPTLISFLCKAESAKMPELAPNVGPIWGFLLTGTWQKLRHHTHYHKLLNRLRAFYLESWMKIEYFRRKTHSRFA